MATHSPSPNTAFKRKPITVNTGWSHDKPLPQINDKDRPCPSCGAPSQAQRMVPKDTAKQDADRASKRIAELEAEVRMLSEKARDAAVRVADCEDEIMRLKKAAADQQKAMPASPPSRRPSTTLSQVAEEPADPASPSDDQPPDSPMPELPPAPAPAPPTQRPSMPLGRALTTTRITNFLTARRAATPSTPSDVASPAGETVADLTQRLTSAENGRRTAEEKLARTNQELEELTASLFSTANEMVSKERREHAEKAEAREQRADERERQWTQWQRDVEARERTGAARARALERKVRRLEGRVQTLEARDRERGARLERLENAMKRAGRVRGLLDAHAMSRP